MDNVPYNTAYNAIKPPWEWLQGYLDWDNCTHIELIPKTDARRSVSSRSSFSVYDTDGR